MTDLLVRPVELEGAVLDIMWGACLATVMSTLKTCFHSYSRPTFINEIITC